MSDKNYFDTKIIQSDYSADFIPAQGKLIIGTDIGSPSGDCTVKGFYKDGIYHVQELTWKQL